MLNSRECLACFVQQGSNAARLAAPEDPALQEALLRDWLQRLATENWDEPAPDLARRLYDVLVEATGVTDPYRASKDEANRRVLELLPGLESLLAEHAARGEDSLKQALGLAIIGNYIDVGVMHEYDWERALDEETDNAWAKAAYPAFARALRPGARVILLCDNCGEIGLDGLLIREMTARGAEVTAAFRAAPILNDATLEDARFMGLDRLCEVVTSGSDAPGTVLSRCAPAFLERLHNADIVLSKGQGNYEALTGRLPGVFFAFKAKCDVVARHLGVPKGRSVFVRE